MAKLQNLAACASKRLQQANQLEPAEARIEIRTLLCHALGNVNHAWLIAHGDDPVTDTQRQSFENLLARRIAGEPIAYILGQREFFGREYKVSPATLIPRPDTEILIETALKKIPDNQPCRILDLGTGTGAIGITLALERPHSEVVIVDFSDEALAVAKENIRQLAASNVTALHSHWYSAVQGQRFNIIVSNPPYIETGDPHLQQGDLRFEPITALASGSDGLDDIRTISSQAAEHLNPSGWLLLEHGYQQGAAVHNILHQHGFINIRIVTDLAGHERVTLGNIPLAESR